MADKNYNAELETVKFEPIESVEIACPYCGELCQTSVDLSCGEQEYIEDCYVCCQPIAICIQFDIQGNFQSVEVKHENE